ncbi:MAG: arginase family protein [Chloroflexi bacterium]|nr:arginase family protein [Chloroflexota bacterium]
MTNARRVDLIGVPFNSDGTRDGVARAPAALRAAGLVEALTATPGEFRDCADIAGGPGGPGGSVRDQRSGIIAPLALATMIRSVREAVAGSLADGALPLVVGGDCPVLIGCLGAVPGRQLPGLLFVDGHEDAWQPHASTTGEAADMELGLLLGIASNDLPAELRREIPLLDPDAVVGLGGRDHEELRRAGVASIADRVETIGPDDLMADPGGVTGRVVDRLGGRGPWWLHVDLDVLSTASLDAVDYRQPGGLDWATLTTVTRRALADPKVAGWDVTIYNPDLDPDGVGARQIVAYVAAALAPSLAPSLVPIPDGGS